MKTLQHILCLLACAIMLSCNSDVTTEEVKVDSTAIRDSIKRHRVLNIMKQVKADYNLDSLNFSYTLDAQKIINKRILIDWGEISDIYTEKDEYHIILYKYSKNGDCLINLTCTNEQAIYILDYIEKTGKRRHKRFYLTITPDYIKKVNLKVVGLANPEDTSVDLSDISELFDIKGRLIDIKFIPKAELDARYN